MTNIYSPDAHVTSFTDKGLRFDIDLDSENAADPNPSIFIKAKAIEIRQFCTIEQLKALRDKLNDLFEWKFIPSKDVNGKAVPECWVSESGEVVYTDPNKAAA